MKQLLVVAMLLTWAGAVLAAPNLLQNGDFEKSELPERWNLNGDVTIVPSQRPGAAGRVVRMSGEGSYKMISQDVALPPGTARLHLEGWARTQNVRSSGQGNGHAQFQLAFQGSDRTQIGDYIDVDLASDSPWTFQDRDYEVPPGAVAAQVLIGLNRAAGAVEFDEVRLEAFDAAGRELQPVTASRTDTKNWFALDTSPADNSRPATVDLSGLLDKPAGRHGFLEVRDGHFAFADGTRAKFWGACITAGDCFPDHVTAERTAARLAKFGFNMVRLHHMDAAWAKPNIWSIEGNTYGKSTRRLAPESLERLDYFIAQLKARGIYIYLDLLVSRRFTAEDGREAPDGAKMSGQFDPVLLALQKEYARALLTHFNPYTKTRYVDEPAVAMSEVINESTLFWLADYALKGNAGLNERFTIWCIEKGTARPEGTVPELVKARNPLVARFLYEVQTRSFVEMRSFLRSLGYRVPIAGSNHWESQVGDLLSNAQLDYIDRHAYWDHPDMGYSATESHFHNRPQVKSPIYIGPENMARTRIAGKPFIVTEWQNVWPNEWITEGPMTMAAYGALQDWDGMLQFDYAGADWADRMAWLFNIGNKPHLLAARVPAALLFLRGDVAPAQNHFTAPLSGADDELFQNITNSIPDGLALVQRVGSKIGAPTKTSAKTSGADRKNGEVFTSQGGQLQWDGRAGVLRINTPRTQGALGFIGGKPLQAAQLRVEAATPFCQIIVSSLDDLPLSGSRRMLVTTTARAENSGQVYRPDRTGLLSEGSAPILMEPVTATLALMAAKPEAARRTVRVYVLDHQGRRSGAQVAVEAVNGAARFRVGGQKTFWYEIER